MIEVQFHRGLYLPEPDLWLDPWDPKPYAYVSHAHADHFSRHQRSLCSDVTATLLRSRFQVAEERLDPVRVNLTRDHQGFRLRLLPAGHIAGSSMLHVTRLRDGATLLYTGDFKVRRGRTSDPVVFQQADTLILETTFGLPLYAFPPQMEVEMQVVRFVHDTLADGEVPVLLGYSLGKAQEALALLHAHDLPAVLHPNVAEMTAACLKAGIRSLPEPVILDGTPPPGTTVIAPPNAVRSKLLRAIPNRRVALLSGWALQPSASYRYRVDEAIPLSDHADYPGLIECIQRVRPKRILTVHGFEREFAADLRQRGFDAWSASGHDQMELSLSSTTLARPTTPLSSTAASARHTRPICPLADFSDLCRLVGETQSRLEKIRHIAAYFKQREIAAEIPIAATWLTGNPLPRSLGKRPLQVGSATLRRALLSLPGTREERYREISLSQNDAARTARLVLQELPLKPEPLDLPSTIQFFESLTQANGSLQRIELLSHRLRHLHPAEGETLVKLLTGDLRIGLKEGLVEDSIAQAFQAEASEVRYAHMLTGNIGKTASLAHQKSLHQATLQPLVPIKVMLASPMPDAATLASQHTHRPLWLEAKFDGIRAQLHKQHGHVSLFSRDLHPLNAEFPELIAAAKNLPEPLILDGEIIAHADGRKLTFFDLQKRLGRPSALQSDLFTGTSSHLPPVRFIAFDLLHDPSGACIDTPLRERRQRLTQLHLSAPFETIRVHHAHSATEAEALFKAARSAGQEGLIAKDPESTYFPGRRGRSWLKLKTSHTLDCVVVAAEQGHGKRAEVLSDYTFAVRDEESGQLRIIGKAYSGLTDAEIEDLTRHFLRSTIEKQRRKHLVEPSVVLEIAFDSIQPSKRHDSGLALRFPRIHAVRRDKSVHDIDTLQYARRLANL